MKIADSIEQQGERKKARDTGAVFENIAEALYKAYTKAALKGNAYALRNWRIAHSAS